MTARTAAIVLAAEVAALAAGLVLAWHVIVWLTEREAQK